MRGAQSAFVGMSLDGIFALTSIFRGAHWRLSGEEKLMAGTHVNNVALAVLPPEYLEAYNGILEKFGPILGAFLPLAGIIGKRIAIDRAIAAEKEAGGAGQRGDRGHAYYSDGTNQPGGPTPTVSEPFNGRTDSWGVENHSW
jgi:hypothetical protein